MTTEREQIIALAGELASRLDYNEISGVFIWKSKPVINEKDASWNTRYAGKEAGTIDRKGYRRICFKFDGKFRFLRLHRLAWFIVHGQLPTAEVDHIDQNKLNNSIANLRDVTKEINQRNATRKSDNTSGASGVSWHKSCKKWQAQVTLNGRRTFLGTYADINEACSVVKKFRAEHGFTETHGRSV